MPETDAPLSAHVREALRAEARLADEEAAVGLRMDADALVMEGEVSSVVTKKLALERAAACPGVSRPRVAASCNRSMDAVCRASSSRYR